MDETISYISKRIQPFKTCIINQEDNNMENYMIDDFINYYHTTTNDEGFLILV